MRTGRQATKAAIGLTAVATSLLAVAASVEGETAATIPSCQTAQLKAGHGFSSGAVGSLVTPLRLRNVSRGTCSLKGYPRVTLLTRHGHVIVRKVPRERGTVAHAVLLDPGRVAQAALRTSISSRTGNSRDCPRAMAVQIAPPHRKRSLRIKITLRVCQADADVGPLRAAPRH